jgi:hypothetical protein
VQSNPICESLGLSHLIIASTSTASYSPKIKVDVIGSKPSAFAEGLWPLADHYGCGNPNINHD